MTTYKKRNLENFDTDMFVTSTVYFPKEDLEKFISAFTALEIIDERLAAYVQILKEIMSSKGFENLPSNSEKRKAKIIELVRAKIKLIPQAIQREKVLNWFNEAVKKEQDLELYDELLDRYCWNEFMDRIAREDKSKNSFRDKLNTKPIIPEIGDNEIKPIEDVEEKQEENQVIFPTGIKLLDSIVKMRKTNFVVVAARTGIGKSLFMLNQAIYNAKKGTKVLYVSLEESGSEIKRRVLAHIADAKPEEKTKVGRNFFVYPAKVSSPDTLFNEVDKVIEKEGIEVVCFDYLQLMKYPGMHDFDSLRVLTRELKLYAISREVLVITASQLRREAEMMGASLSTIYGSATVEADSNIVLLIEPVNANAQKIENRCPVILNIAKNRSGESKKIDGVMIDYSNGHIGISS